MTANETNWLHVLLTDDPGLFDGFIDRDDDSIFKTMWHGEFPGKLLTGIAQTYLLNNDPETKRVGDAIAGKLKEVQEPDGYLGPWKKSVRYEADVAPGSWGKWDTWGQYHCIYGLLRWYQVTGNRDAFNTAKRALDNIYDHFIAGGISIAAQNWAEWAVLSGRNELYLNYYGECSLETVLENGHKIVLTQKTEYPADGAVNIKIDTGCPDELTLYFRIPSWSVNTVLTVNGEAVNAEAGSYCAVKRVWKSGDSVRLVLDMSPHFLVNDAVKPVKISVYYGPLLLAFRTGSGLSRNTRFNIEALRKMVRVEGDAWSITAFLLLQVRVWF